MSYLMAMYVYYHGNNLVAFGIIKGLKDEQITNSGMKRASEINPSLVDPNLIAEVQRQEELEKQDTYEDIMRKAIKESQKRSFELYQRGMANNQIFENTPDAIVEDPMDSGSISLDFFNTLNGF